MLDSQVFCVLYDNTLTSLFHYLHPQLNSIGFFIAIKSSNLYDYIIHSYVLHMKFFRIQDSFAVAG